MSNHETHSGEPAPQNARSTPAAPAGGEPTREPARTLRVVVIHPLPIVRHGLAALLAERGGFEVVAQLERETDLDGALAERADVAIVGLAAAAVSAAGRRLARAFPRVAFLAITQGSSAPWPLSLRRDGLRGCVDTAAPLDTIVEATREVGRGQLYAWDRAIAPGAEPAPEEAATPRLSRREAEVFELIAEGWSVSRIASHFGVSVKTIEKHRERIKHKLGLHSSAQLLVRAVETRLSGGLGER